MPSYYLFGRCYERAYCLTIPYTPIDLTVISPYTVVVAIVLTV